MNKGFFIDRDGIINHPIIINNKPFSPRSVSDLSIIDGVDEALMILKKLGFTLVIVSNQPDIARGKMLINDLEDINSLLFDKLPIDQINYCIHDDSDCCECRKPLPGLIINSAKKLNINLNESYMIGDRCKDIAAGINAGCKTFFVDYCYDEDCCESPDYKVNSLLDAAKFMLKISTHEH